MRMSSRSIPLVTLAAVSLTLAACRQQPPIVADCVTEANGQLQKVHDRNCEQDQQGGGAYFWQYGGTVDKDGRVRGGTSRRPQSGTVTTRSGRIVHGGFGGHGGSGG